MNSKITSNGSVAYMHERMGKPENFNFHDYVPKDVDQHLVIEGSWQKEFEVFSSSDIVRGISIVVDRGEIDLSFLHLFPKIEVLLIRGGSLSSFEKIESLPELEYLSLSTDKNQTIKLLFPKKLKSFACTWKDKFHLDRLPDSLEYLMLEKAKTFDFKGHLPFLQKLTKLELISCEVNCGDEILELSNLRYLAMTNCKGLRFSGTNISNDNVKYISCGKTSLKNLDWVTGLKALDVLVLEDCDEIEEMTPLAGKKTLRGLWISGNTKFKNGELDTLETIPNLINFFLRDFRHYTHRSLIPWNWKRFSSGNSNEPVFKRK